MRNIIIINSFIILICSVFGLYIAVKDIFYIVPSPFVNTQKAHINLDIAQNKLLSLYQQEFAYNPLDGHLAFYLAKSYAINGSYKIAADYLQKSYKLYPLSKYIGQERYQLGFILYNYLDKDKIARYRYNEYNNLLKTKPASNTTN